MIHSDEGVDHVRAQAEAMRMKYGVRGVPLFVVGGKYKVWQAWALSTYLAGVVLNILIYYSCVPTCRCPAPRTAKYVQPLSACLTLARLRGWHCLSCCTIPCFEAGRECTVLRTLLQYECVREA